MKFRSIIIAAIIIISVSASFYFSREIYTFYNRIYYKVIKKADYGSMLNKAKDLYRAKRYNEAAKLIGKMELIFDETAQLNRLKGLNLIKLGRDREGVELLLSAFKKGQIENETLNEALAILAAHGLYNDLIKIFEENDVKMNGINLFYYGISLFKTGRYKRSIAILKEAVEKIGAASIPRSHRAGIYYYMGLARESVGDLKESLKNLKQAKKLDANNKNVDNSLIRVYTKLGKYYEAERIIRRKKI